MFFQVSNPVPRVVHPDWLHKKVREKDDKMRQRKLVDIFSSLKKGNEDDPQIDANGKNHVPHEQNVVDLEDFGSKGKASTVGSRPIVRSYETNTKTSGQGSSREKRDQDKNSNRLMSLSQPIDINDEEIDRHLDYQGWLDSRKRKWKQIRDRRKRQK